MVDRQQMPIGVVKFPSAFSTDETVNLQRPLPVIALRKRGLLQFFDHFINRFTTDSFLSLGESSPFTVFQFNNLRDRMASILLILL
jgi:hypothetical protein